MSAPMIDQQAHDWFVAHRDGWLNSVEKAVTFFGSTSTVVLLTLLFAGFLVWRSRNTAQAVYLAATVSAACAVLFTVKEIVKRPRPPSADWLTDGPGYSFPSGHATLSAALATALVILAVQGVGADASPARRRQRLGNPDRLGRWAWLVVGLGVLYSLLIGVSRLYLGVHWLTDVASGWLVGIAVAVGTAVATRTAVAIRTGAALRRFSASSQFSKSGLGGAVAASGGSPLAEEQHKPKHADQEPS